MIGKIIQIVKHRKLPKSPVTFSKAGNRIAIPTKVTLHKTRTTALAIPRIGETPDESLGRVRASSPVKTSTVVMMGRAL